MSATDDDFVADLLPAFIEEAHEQIAAFEQLMLQLEDTPGDLGLLGALFRCAHTVKGSAGVFGLERVVAFTHHVESLLDQLREGRLVLTPGLSTLLLQSNDAIRELVDAPPELDAAERRQAREQLVLQLRAATGAADAGAPAPAQPRPTVEREAGVRRWQLSVRFGPELFRDGMDPLSILNYLGGMGTLGAVRCEAGAVPELDQLDPERCHLALAFDLDTAAPREKIEEAFSFVREACQLQLQELAAAVVNRAPADTAPPQPRGAAPAAVVDDGGYIRVHARRLDEVMNLLGELVIAGAGASQLARQARQRPLIEANQQITRLIEGIRNSTLKLRMVPIGDTFARFRRVVRDTAASLGKDVALEIAGGDTELDKAVVERIADPLMHLVRNALDHGLEPPAERLAAGKPAQGRLTLAACHESGSILIRISDNGRGIQREKVLARARQRGLVGPGVSLSEAEILALIFAPGFSTAEKVTDLSGRGVGMDVVRSNIEALRGSVAIESTEGQGSCIEIRLPLTLAIIDGFLVGVGSSRFIFPLDAVVEVLAHHAGSVTLNARGRGCVELRGRLLPVIDLRTLYGLEAAAGPTSHGSIVVARHGPQRFGVLVDSLLGQHQTVIKPLARLMRNLRAISGSTILGSGEVALIFDVDALGKLAAGPRTTTPSSRHPDSAAATAADLIPQGDRS